MAHAEFANIAEHSKLNCQRRLQLTALLFAVAIAGSSLPVGSSVAAEPDDSTSESVPLQNSSSAEPATSPISRNRAIEEVIVTSQKREENLQDVPISINAFSADTLDARGVTDPSSLPLVTPGLVFNHTAAFTVIYIRGVGADTFLMADPSIATYIDGIYFPFNTGAAQGFGTVDRIEVLKGPQGTLFGRNAVGGAISITTPAPDFSTSQVSLATSYSSHDTLETRASINIPLADNFAFSVSGFYNTADNPRAGFVGGEPVPKEIQRAARIKLRWAPSDNTDLLLAGFKLEQSGLSSFFSTNSDPTPLGRALLMQAQPYDGARLDAPEYFDLDNSVVYGQGTLKTDPLDLKLLGSYQHIRTASLYDFDGTPVPIAEFHVSNQFAYVETAELQLISNETSWGSDWLQWIGGYYYFHGKQGLDPARFLLAGSVLNAAHDLVGQLPGGSFLEQLGLVLPNSEDGLLDAGGRVGADSNSVFGQATAHVTDWMALTAGLRYQIEKRLMLKSVGQVVLPVGPDERTLAYINSPRTSDTTKSLSPKVSLDFRPWDDGLIYLSWQKATKSSTYNVINFLPFLRLLSGELQDALKPQLVKPERITAYEIGLKTTLFDGNMRLNTAAFWYEQRDLQVQFISLLAGGVVTFENAPAARIRGIDFDIVSQLFPSLVDGVALTLGGCLLNTEYTKFPSGQGYNIDTGIYQANIDLTGNRISRSPKFSGSASLSYSTDIHDGTLEIATDYYYNSGYGYLAQVNPRYTENEYGVLGVHASYLYEPWKTRVTVFGRNILDKRYRQGMITSDFGPLSYLAPPTVYGLRVNWDF